VLQFVRLWEALREVHLNDTADDDITWRWTADGVYTTRSAYQVQFVGVFSRMKITPIWKAKAEQKCRFFAWTWQIICSNVDEPTIQIASFAITIRKLQFIYARIVHSPRRFGAF